MLSTFKSTCSAAANRCALLVLMFAKLEVPKTRDADFQDS